jgi:exopolysaccharide biosynthesis polyprenyl glycosylphosphotransferase
MRYPKGIPVSSRRDAPAHEPSLPNEPNTARAGFLSVAATDGTTVVHGETSQAQQQARVPAIKPAPPLRKMLIGIDLVMVALGWMASLLVANAAGNIGFGPLTVIAQTGLMLGGGTLLLSASGLYRRRISAIRSLEIARIGRVSMVLGAMATVVLASVSREAALLAGVVGASTWFILLAVERGVVREWINGRRATGDFAAPVLVIGGTTKSTVDTARFLAENPVLGFRVCGISSPSAPRSNDSPFGWFGPPEQAADGIRQCGAAGVVLDSSSFGARELNDVVHDLDTIKAHIHISSGLRGVDVRRISLSPIADEAFLHLSPTGLNRYQVMIKRAADIVGATIALVVLSPVLLVAGSLIWLQDRDSVLFRQYRVGKDGELFELLKLRTMVKDAEKLRAKLEEANERSGPLFKLSHDPRVTRIGRFLRASSIDEIPQLFNVLQGSMSLVGPRPALPDEVAMFDEQMSARLTVKPGVTGLWQVEARDLPSFDLYRRYDLLYVQNWSFGVDVAIIARTVVVVGLRAVRSILPVRYRSAEMVR